MWSYLATELPDLIAAHFPADRGRQSIMGHSMGGHGALTLGLTYGDPFKSVSAFSPIVAPSAVRAAIASQWRSGRIEGQITKPDLDKRQKYGRGKIELRLARPISAT